MAESYNVITSGTTKSGSGSGTFVTAYAATPKFFYGIYKLSSKPNDAVLEFDVNIPTLSTTGFTYSWTVGGSSTINSLSISTMSYVNNATTNFISTNYNFTAASNCSIIQSQP